jgi:tRNA threonylcarbamoyladenosine biosynthesis protein TsaB
MILGFDTSHGKSSVAISDGDNIIATMNSHKTSAQAEELISLIERTLTNAHLDYKDIDYLAVTTGPGSFTGIRIGLAAARGIMLASNIKPVAITAFEAINFRIMMHARQYDYSAIIINAYRGQVYAQVFDNKGATIAEPVMIDIEETARYLSQFKGRLAVAGSGLPHIDNINDAILLPRFPFPEARSLCRLASTKILSGVYSDDISPLYIRPPDAKLPKFAGKDFTK